MSPPSAAPRTSFSVIGIHLAGNQTGRSAVVRGHFVAQEIWSGYRPAAAPALLSFLSQKFVGLPVREGVPGPLATEVSPSPLVINNFLSHVGPAPDKDADQRLCEALRDLGSADFYVLDVPLSLPPCATCLLECPGARHCQVPEVVRMNDLWSVLRKQGRRLRSPQPYLDRYADYFARQIFEQKSPPLFSEFESPQGSNRAPLVARARYLSRWIQSSFGVDASRVIETHSSASALAWFALAQAHAGRGREISNTSSPSFPASAAVPAPLPFAGHLRREGAGRGIRRSVFDSLASAGRLTVGANLQGDYALDLVRYPGAFLAAISALTVRSLAAGEVFFQDDFVNTPELLGRQPLLPASLGFFIAGWERGTSSTPAES